MMSSREMEFNAPVTRVVSGQEAAVLARETVAAGRHCVARWDDDAGPPWRVDLYERVTDRGALLPPFARCLVHADGRVEPVPATPATH